MSNYLNLIEAKFHIAEADKRSAYVALAKKVTDSDGYIYGDLLWVDCSSLEEAKTLEEQLDAFRWPVETDDNGNIVGIRFAGSKEGEETLLFRTIAPYVRSQSCIVVEGGSDNRRWQWEFLDCKCKKKRVAKPRVKPSDLGEYYKTKNKRSYAITIETHCVDIRTAADLERRLRDAIQASNCELIGYLPRHDRLAEVLPGNIAAILERDESDSKCGSIELVLSREPECELSVKWHEPARIDGMKHVFASYTNSTTTSAYSYATVRVWCGEGTDKRAAESLFENLVRFLKPFWGEFIDCTQVGTKYSFAGMNAHTHYVPHLASMNYFGVAYADFFGGAEQLTKAGCEKVTRTVDGVFFGVQSISEPQKFQEYRDTIEQYFSDLDAFGGESSKHRKVPAFPLPPVPNPNHR